MKSSFLLLMLACSFGQADGEWVLSPQLAPGLELVYSGTSTEESLLPGVQYQRVYRIENHVFVLAGDAKGCDVAFMTTLSAREPGAETKFQNASVKLELAKVDAQGRLKAALPGATLHSPVGLPPILETGCFVEAPGARVGRNSFWEVAEEGRPPRSWYVQGAEMCGGLLCAKMLGQQQSEDWDRPRSDRTAWRRRDVVWLSLQMGVAVKVERIIERRDPARREPSHRTVTQYSLESRLRYPGKLFDDRKAEVLQARKFGDDAGTYLRQPAQFQTQMDTLSRKVVFHIENTPTTPYRKAVIHLAQRIDSARKGELLLAEYTEDAPTPIGPLREGQKVPDTLLTDWTGRSSVRLSRALGRPTLVVYYNPHTKTGVEVLTFAKDLAEKFGDRASVLAMAVTTDADFARQQHADMKLPFPIHDGGALRITFAVEATPRFVVLDAEGCLKASATGWGSHVPDELRDHLRRNAPTPDAAPLPNP